MSGQNGFGNEYAYSGPGQYDANDAYSGSSSLGVSGYSGRNAGASSAGGRSERRPGGYGGFYQDSPQPPALSPGQSSTPSQSQSPERRHDHPNRDWQQPSSQSKSRSRSRNQEPDRRPQDERSRDQRRYADNKEQDSNASLVTKRSNTSGEAQAIESLSFSLDLYCGLIANKCAICSDIAIHSTQLGLYDRCRVCSGTCCSEFDGYEYIGQGGPRRRLFTHV
jgi:hypothetical protein